MDVPPERKHRVVIYVTCYNVLDGVTLTLRKIEQEILAQGHSVCILSTNSGNSQNTHTHMEEKQFQRYRHLPNRHPNRTIIFLDNAVPIPFLHDPNNPKDSYHLGFSISAEVRKKLDDFGPTIVHVTVPDVTCMHLIQYARDRQLPLMGTYHSNIPDYFTHYPGIGWLKHVVACYERHNYNFLQALFVPTPFIRRHLTIEEHYRFDKVTDLKVWGRGVDLKQFHPSRRSEDFRARYGFAPDDVVVIWVGRLVPEKRLDIFAYVVRRLADEGINFKALIVGAGPCEADVKSLPNTTFAGWVTGDELAVAYASSDVFLFPSAVETFGNVTLEAAASGLPVIVDSGCSGHLVQDGVNGFSCTEDDLESYYNGTLSLVLDNSRRKAMSMEGRKFSLRFEKRTVCRKMIDNYSNVTEEFYHLYRGNHTNRDRIYESKPDSFAAGSYLRPTSLVFVEYIFILAFRFFYRVGEIIFSARRCLAFLRSRKPFRSTTSAQTVVKIKNGSIPLATSSASLTSSQSIDSSINTGLVISTGQPCDYQDTTATYSLNGIFEMADHADGGDADSIDNSILSCDEASSATCSTASTINTRPYEDRFWRCELPVSHNLAILFTKTVMAQGRLESRIRKRYTHRKLVCHSHDGMIARKRNKRIAKIRKRKCSEDINPDDFNGRSMLNLQLTESLLPVGCSCSSTDSCAGSDQSLVEDNIDPGMASTNIFVGRAHTEHRLNSRKVKLSSNLQI